MIGNFHAILNFNQLFLKLNQFICNLMPVLPDHWLHTHLWVYWINSYIVSFVLEIVDSEHCQFKFQNRSRAAKVSRYHHEFSYFPCYSYGWQGQTKPTNFHKNKLLILWVRWMVLLWTLLPSQPWWPFGLNDI